MGAPSEGAISDSPSSSANVIQSLEGEGIPGEVNIEWYKTALDAIQPDRFQGVRLLHEKCRHDESPMLVAQDTSMATRPQVMLQVFTTHEEFARARDCAVRCCECPVPACLASSPRSPKYAASPSKCRSPSRQNSELSGFEDDSGVCCIHEVHGNSTLQQWCVVMEPNMGTKGGDTLDARLRRGLLSKGEARRVFLHTARGVQALHRAGLVHNAICPQNIISVKNGMKLGNFAALQRQGEERRQSGPGHSLSSPERALACQMRQPFLVDFATDVWCLGLLLHELICGEPWPGLRTQREIDDDLLESAAVSLPAVPVGEEGSEDALAKALLTRLLAKHPAQRPVVDVVLSDAVATLFPSCELDHPEPSSPTTPASKRSASSSPPAKRPSVSPSHSPVRGSCEEGPPARVLKDVAEAEQTETPERPVCECRCLLM